jgi:hypothetical protein
MNPICLASIDSIIILLISNLIIFGKAKITDIKQIEQTEISIKKMKI